MDQKAIYTNFPNLYGTIKSKHTQATLQLDWFVSPPQEILILSWATLLQSYTSTTEPVFLFEGKAIQVNLPVSSWTEVEVEDASAQDGHHTAITLNKVGLQKGRTTGNGIDPHLAIQSACASARAVLQP